MFWLIIGYVVSVVVSLFCVRCLIVMDVLEGFGELSCGAAFFLALVPVLNVFLWIYAIGEWLDEFNWERIVKKIFRIPL